MLHAGFKKISLSRQNKFGRSTVDSSEGVGRKGRMLSTTDRHRAGILDAHSDQQIRRQGFRGTVTSGDGSNQKGRKMGANYVNLREEEKKAAEESRTRRERIQLEPSGTRDLCLGITWHPCDKEPCFICATTKQCCKKMGRRKRKSDFSTSTRRGPFMGSNRRALANNNGRSSDISGLSESASRRT